MQPGEKVVSTVNFEGKILIFGEYGSIVEMWQNFDVPGHYRFSIVGKVPQK